MGIITRQRVFSEIEEQGLDTIQKSTASMNREAATLYDKHIKDYEESKVLERREEREEITLSMSRKALRNSRFATIIAIAAIISAILDIILTHK